MDIIDEQSAFSEWFDAVWLGDREHIQHIPTIQDSDYGEYMEARQLAQGAWMQRAKLSDAPTPPVQQEVELDLAAAAKMLRKVRSEACPTTEAGWKADAMYIAKAALNDLNDPYASDTLVQRDDEVLEVLRLALDALVESVDQVQHDYDTDWRHNIPTRASQLQRSLDALTAHKTAIDRIRTLLEKRGEK